MFWSLQCVQKRQRNSMTNKKGKVQCHHCWNLIFILHSTDAVWNNLCILAFNRRYKWCWTSERKIMNTKKKERRRRRRMGHHICSFLFLLMCHHHSPSINILKFCSHCFFCALFRFVGVVFFSSSSLAFWLWYLELIKNNVYNEAHIMGSFE